MNIKRGSVWLANLDPTVGSEIRKTRPVVVVSNDINNINNNVVTVLPITSNTTHVFSFEVLLSKGVAGLPKDSKAKADQIRTLDKSRLVRSIGMLPDAYRDLIDNAMKLHLGLK